MWGRPKSPFLGYFEDEADLAVLLQDHSMHKCVCETCQVRWGVVPGGEDDDCNSGGDADVHHKHFHS